MNLLSLPDEMLANVCKFSKFETVVLLRKMNVRIDAVTLRYGINKPKIYSFSAYQKGVSLTNKITDIHADCKNAVDYPYRQWKLESSNPFEMIELWLKKIRYVQRFCFNYLEMDDKSLDVLARITHKNRSSLVFYECKFKVSLETMEKVLSRFGTVRIVSKENTILNENFASDKVMCSLLSYAEIYYMGSAKNFTNLPAVTDKTLLELQRYLPNCFMLRLSRANFTIPEIIRTIKVALQNRDCTKLEWYLGRMHVETREELNRIIEEFRNIEGIRISDMAESTAFITFKGQKIDHSILWSINCD